MKITLFIGLMVAIGCGEKSTESKNEKDPTATAPSAPTPTHTEPTASTGEPRVAKVPCGCRMLTVHPFEALDTGMHEKLCDGPLLGADRCGTYDTYRNCIYAAHGYKFKTKKYQAYFSKTDWYQPRDNFSEGELSKIETDNIRLLKNKAKACETARAKRPSLSKDDLAIVKKWMVYKKPPPIVWTEIDEGLSTDSRDVEARAGYMKFEEVEVSLGTPPQDLAKHLADKLKGQKYRALDISECVECEKDHNEEEHGWCGCSMAVQLIVGESGDILAIFLTVAAG